MPKTMRPMLARLLAFKLPILLHTSDEVPAVASDLFEQSIRRVPAIHQHVLRFYAQPLCPPQQFRSKHYFAWPALAPYLNANWYSPFAIRPDQHDQVNTPDYFLQSRRVDPVDSKYMLPEMIEHRVIELKLAALPDSSLREVLPQECWPAAATHKQASESVRAEMIEALSQFG